MLWCDMKHLMAISWNYNTNNKHNIMYLCLYLCKYWCIILIFMCVNNMDLCTSVFDHNQDTHTHTHTHRKIKFNINFYVLCVYETNYNPSDNIYHLFSDFVECLLKAIVQLLWFWVLSIIHCKKQILFYIYSNNNSNNNNCKSNSNLSSNIHNNKW